MLLDWWNFFHHSAGLSSDTSDPIQKGGITVKISNVEPAIPAVSLGKSA